MSESDRPVYDLTALETITEELDHPECAVWSGRRVLYAGGEAGQIYEVTLDGAVRELARGEGEILGLAVDGSDMIYACDTGAGAVVRVNPATGDVETYSRGITMETPNFLCFDQAGNLYVTDSGGYLAHDGSVVRISPIGEATIWCDLVGRYPNGCCLDESGSGLYVVESYLPGVTRIPIEADGSAGEPEVVVRLPDCVPDGIAVDVEGVLYVTSYRPDRVYRLSRGGAPEILLDDPHGAVLCAPTNVAFIGDSLNRLVVANVGEWHLGVIDVGVAGLPLVYPTMT